MTLTVTFKEPWPYRLLRFFKIRSTVTVDIDKAKFFYVSKNTTFEIAEDKKVKK